MPRSGPVTRDTTTVQLGLAQIRVGPSVSNIGSIAPVFAADDSLGAMASTSYTGETEYWDLESGFPLGLDATFPLRETNIIECAFKEITPKTLALARGISPFNNISAAWSEVGSVTSAGTTTGDITMTDDAGPTTEVWTVVFETATTGAIYGSVTGHVHDFTDLTTIMAPVNGANPYFSIPVSYFTGTWAADETYVFQTTEYVAGTTAYDSAHAGSIALGTIAAPEFVRVEALYTFPDPTNTMTIIFPRCNITSSLNIDFQAEDAAAVTMTMKSMTASSDVAGGNAVWDGSVDAGPNGRIVFA